MVSLLVRASHRRVGLVPRPRRARVQRVLPPQRARTVHRAVRQQPHVVGLHHVAQRAAAVRAPRPRPAHAALRVALVARQQVERGAHRARRLQLRHVGARRHVRAAARRARQGRGFGRRAGRADGAGRGSGRRHERRGLVVAGLVPRRAALARAAAARHDLVPEASESLGGADLAQDVGGAAQAAQLEVDDGRAAALGVVDGERARLQAGGGRVVVHEQRGGARARRGAALVLHARRVSRPRAERDLSVRVRVLLVLHVEGDGGRVAGRPAPEAAAALEDGGVAPQCTRGAGGSGATRARKTQL